MQGMVGSSEYAELRIGTGEDMGMKQEKYFRLIKEKCEHLAKVKKLYKSGNGQLYMD